VKLPVVVDEVILNEDTPDVQFIESDVQKLQIFTPEYLLTIEQAIAVYIETKPYVDKKFNVSIMSVGLNIPSHHLSYYFSNVLCIKFTDWRNRLRVQYASELLREGLLDTLTLHVIASNSGFSNQTTFIEEFKRIYGSTPSNYFKSINAI
jgi:AraC-like DNA-binding protein